MFMHLTFTWLKEKWLFCSFVYLFICWYGNSVNKKYAAETTGVNLNCCTRTNVIEDRSSEGWFPS